MEDQPIKYGRVAVIGRPNTGKSTLINAIMGQKVAITSPLPQTTRKANRVLYADQRGKIILVDTPGIVGKVTDLVGKRVNLEAPKEAAKTDVLVCLVDISRPKNEEENKMIGLARKSGAKKILVYNKIDKATGSKDHLADYNYLEPEFDKVVGVSAINGKNIGELLRYIFELLPKRSLVKVKKEVEAMDEEGRPKITMSSNEYIAELIREKAYLFLRDELPYSVNVKVEEVKEKKEITVVKATIYTNQERYKKMIIGKNGSKIKEIGYNARKELELMSGRRVFLELMVKLDKHWAERMI